MHFVYLFKMGNYKAILQLGSIYRNNVIVQEINLKLDLVNVYILKSSNKTSVMVELYKYNFTGLEFYSSGSPPVLFVFAFSHCNLQEVCMIYSEVIDSHKAHELGHGWGGEEE